MLLVTSWSRQYIVPEGELNSWNKCSYVLGQRPRQHLDKLGEKSEASLSRLNALLLHLTVHRLHNGWYLELE